MFKRIKDWMERFGKAADKAALRKQVIKAVVSEFDSARHKLGESFFTRRLSPGSRRARLRSLTKFERVAARSAGWIR